MNKILLTHFIVAPVILLASLLMKIWPPKKINYLYGYRTPRSMKNQLNWNIANTYSADLMMWAGITNVGVHILSYLIIGGKASIFLSLGYFLTFIFVSIYLVEKRLDRVGQ
jgi:uncharacterized membrane protein